MKDELGQEEAAGGKGPRERRRLTLGRGQKLKSKETMDAVYQGGKKKSHFPLVVHGLRRKDHGPSRLGISIGRKCGSAVERNTIKRRIREAYRLMQYELADGMDWLVVVRPHKALAMRTYQDKLRQMMG